MGSARLCSMTFTCIWTQFNLHLFYDDLHTVHTVPGKTSNDASVIRAGLRQSSHSYIAIAKSLDFEDFSVLRNPVVDKDKAFCKHRIFRKKRCRRETYLSNELNLPSRSMKTWAGSRTELQAVNPTMSDILSTQKKSERRRCNCHALPQLYDHTCHHYSRAREKLGDWFIRGSATIFATFVFKQESFQAIRFFLS